MKLQELKEKIQEYQYLEDTSIIDASVASVIATRLMLGSPIWLMIIGASSGGKSQILRPLALTDEKFMHRVDDLTENTFLSGAKVKKDQDNPSLLHKIGEHGMLIISDLTVLFSKSAESKATILSQFRMIFDGEMTKYSGNSSEPITWKGSLGVLAGSTPSAYAMFEEVSEMGERFIYYRMKEYDPMKATRLALSRTIYGNDLDMKLSALYQEYMKDAMDSYKGEEIVMKEEAIERLIEISSLAEKIRTPVHMDFKNEKIVRIPIPAMPMRVAQQLLAISKGLAVMQNHETGSFELDEEKMLIMDWCCYSLANEEKRAVLKALASVGYGMSLRTSVIADAIGLDTMVTRLILQNLTALSVLKRTGSGDELHWKIQEERDHKTIRRVEGIVDDKVFEDRQMTYEESMSAF